MGVNGTVEEDNTTESKIEVRQPAVAKVVPKRKYTYEKDTEGEAKHTKIEKGIMKAEKKSGGNCYFCMKKLRFTNKFLCRCGNTYCVAHRHSERHKCTFDYKLAAKKKLSVANPKIKPNMIGDDKYDL